MKLLTGKEIKPLDNQINKSDSSLIPKLPFTLQIVGSKGSSKSTTIINMLINKDMLAGKFNQVKWISPTSKLDSKLNILKETPILKPNTALIKEIKKSKKIVSIVDSNQSNVTEYSKYLDDIDFIEDCSIDYLKDLIKEQKFVVEKYGKDLADNILLIYDDCASEKRFFNSEVVKKLIYNSRHVNISVIFSVQNYKSISKPIRLNNSILILYDTNNKSELNNIYEENCSSLTFNSFYDMFKQITETPYQFLVINYQNPLKFRYQICFKEFV